MSEKPEIDTLPERHQPINLQGRMRVSDDGDLVMYPSTEDRRYPFMPTVVEVLAAYCIQSDLEIPETVFEILTKDVRRFCREEWNEDKLKIRRTQNDEKRGMLIKGNPYMLGSFTTCVLKDRGMKDVGENGAYGYFKEMCERVANDETLQDFLETELPESSKGLLGNTGFKSYLIR